MKLSQLESLVARIKLAAEANQEFGGAADPEVSFWIIPGDFKIRDYDGAFVDLVPRADVLDPAEPLRHHTAGLGQCLSEKPEKRGNFQIPLVEFDLSL